MKAFVTGASGFIGRHLVQQLVDKNYQVYGLTRTRKGADLLTSIGANPVIGSIFDADSMRSDMEGSDVVFHCAGWDKIGSDEWMLAESVNVAGTRTVLRLAEDLGVPKIIHTSSATVFGDTRGRLVDESFQQGGPFLTEFERTKWLAHYKVAQPMINDGGLSL